MYPRTSPAAAHALAEGVTIVVPTRGRTELVIRLLQALQEERLRTETPTEVIVVDDTPWPDYEQIQQAAKATGSTFLRGPRRVGLKRNVGAAMGRFPVVLFIDSDCEPQPGLIDAHLRAYISPDVAAVAGPTELAGAETGVWRGAEEHSREFNVAFCHANDYVEVLWATTSNLSVRRDAFEKIGGFASDTLTIVGGEDVDLGVRLCEAGFRVVTDLDARVWHARTPIGSAKDVAHRLYTYGRGGSWLCARHPGRRRWRVNPISAVAVATVAAGLVGSATRKRHAAALPIATFLTLWTRATADRVHGGRGSRQAVAVAARWALLDWSFDAGEFVGALQTGRPQNLFRRFKFEDPDRFIPRPANNPLSLPYERDGNATDGGPFALAAAKETMTVAGAGSA